MPTQLTKPITRELLARTGDRTMIIEIGPPDLLTFRQKGRRTRYEISLHQCFNLALMNKIDQDHKDKLERYELRRKAGAKGLKKPRKPSLAIFSKHLRVALATKPPG